VASFLGSDTGTQGNWQGFYGADGYSLAGGPQSLPSYDPSFAVTNAQVYTWTTATTDVRALQNGSSRIAAVWYSGSSFSFDVNITDGNMHQIALYALDWDSYGGVARAETVQVVNATTGTPLDSRSITNCTGGVYLIWNISGHVKINVTWTAGANAVVNGVFFGSGNPAAPLITSTNSTTFPVGTPGTFTVTATGFPAPTLSETGALPSGVTFNTTTGVLSGMPGAGTNGSYPIMFTASNSVSSNTQNFTLTVSPASSTAAVFVGTDTVTEGNWQGKYGAGGYFIANTSYQSPPGYAGFTEQNGTAYTWVSSTTDPRALAIPGGSGGVASCWYSGSSFSFDVNITDGNSHQIALYGLDWDSLGRGETIQIVDGNNPNTVLSTQSISSFSGGTYLLWTISGHVKINVTVAAGMNAVISGVFFK
jgi:hypothetical protein